MDEISVRVVVEGRVQGVGYRAFAVHGAQLRGLRGWVRNRRDGAVEALLIGKADAVEDAIAACRRGPRSAQVTNLAREPAEDDGSSGFNERATV
jgi:acylphosphatase